MAWIGRRRDSWRWGRLRRGDFLNEYLVTLTPPPRILPAPPQFALDAHEAWGWERRKDHFGYEESIHWLIEPEWRKISFEGWLFKPGIVDD